MNKFFEDDEVFCMLPEDIKIQLRYLCNNIHFTKWFNTNKSKIRGKFRGASNLEDKRDVLSELKTAATLLKTGHLKNLIYEPDGRKIGGPDFRAEFPNEDILYVESKRIRRTKTEEKRDELLTLLIERVKSIPLNIGLTFNISCLKRVGLSEHDTYDYLIKNIDEIIRDIYNKLVEVKDNFDNGKAILFESSDNFEINIYNVPIENQTGKIRYYGDLYNCPISGKEYRKFGDIILEKITQLKENEKNMIFIITDNDSHDFEDLIQSINSIRDLVRCDDSELFKNNQYDGIEDFLLQAKKLSGIYVLSKAQEGNVWFNPDAELKLTETIIKYFDDIKGTL